MQFEAIDIERRNFMSKRVDSVTNVLDINTQLDKLPKRANQYARRKTFAQEVGGGSSGISRRKNEERSESMCEEESLEATLLREYYAQSIDEEGLALSGPPKFKFIPTTFTLRKMILKACYTKKKEILLHKENNT